MAKFTITTEDNFVPPVERTAPKAEAKLEAKLVPPPIETVVPAAPQPAPVPPPVTPVTPPPAAAPVAPQPEITFIAQEPTDQPVKKEEEHWVKGMWRPAMGWLYMLICLMDFVVFPAIAMFLPVLLKGIGSPMAYVAWQSLTLSNGGLIHMAFGAILGVAAYGRTQEKVANKQ